MLGGLKRTKSRTLVLSKVFLITARRLGRIAKIVLSAGGLDNSNKDSQPKISIDYDVVVQSASKLRAGHRTRARPRYAHFAALLLALTLS